jgi:hypothetical protein
MLPFHHRSRDALALQKTRFIVSLEFGEHANMRTSHVADRLPSKHDGSSYNRSASQELSGGIAPKIETWNRFSKQ